MCSNNTVVFALTPRLHRPRRNLPVSFLLSFSLTSLVSSLRGLFYGPLP